MIVKFGEKYKQWNAAFDAGYAAALKKSIIVIHSDDHQHALKDSRMKMQPKMLQQ